MTFVLLRKYLTLNGIHYVDSSKKKKQVVLVCYQSHCIYPTSIYLKKSAKTFQSTKACRKRQFLSKPFLLSQLKIETETERNNPQTFSKETDETEDSELTLLESSFSDLAQSILLN